MLLIFIFFSLITMNVSTSEQYVEECASLLQEYANSAADFMLCALTNARPIHMCSSCVGSYIQVLDSHSKILEISDSNNITCRDKLINLDRLEIIEAGFIYVTSLWGKGRCQNCFEDGVPRPDNLSNSTKLFQQMYQATEGCLSYNFNPDNQSYTSNVCSNCSSFYYQMNHFYDGIKTKYGDGEVCMDTVDCMNITQNLWSEVLQCGKEELEAEVTLIACCATVLSLPIIFYLTAWKLASSNPSPISLQKRLRSRFVERWRSSSIISRGR